MCVIMIHMIFMQIPSLYIAIRASQSKISHFRFLGPVTLNKDQGHPKVKFHIFFDSFNHLVNFVRIGQKIEKI